MKKSTRNSLIIGLAVILVVSLLGMLTQGFQKWKWDDVKDTAVSKFVPERNPDNLIETVTLEDGKDSTSDVSYKVDKYGRVTLNGVASANSQITYATVTLPAGTYYLTGDYANSSNRTEYLGIYDSNNQLVKRADMGSFTVSAQATYTIRIAVFADAELRNVEIAPVLSTAEDTPFFAER